MSAVQTEPNQGEEIGEIRQPVWGESDRIFVFTGRLDQGTFVRGIYQIDVDSTSYSYKTFHPFSFPYFINDFDYDRLTQDLAVTFSPDQFTIRTVIANGLEPNLVVVDTLVSSTWYPRSARFVGNGSGVIAYARDPTSKVAGFYFFSTSTAQDSLVLAAELSIDDARGFDIAGGLMCFGVSSDTSDVTSIHVLDLNGDRIDRLVAVLQGLFVSASVHPSGSCAIVSTNVFLPDPGSIVGLVDLATGAFTRVGVRTRQCGYVIADFPRWNPRGDAFAFSGSGFNGEGEVYPSQLWVRRSITCH